MDSSNLHSSEELGLRGQLLDDPELRAGWNKIPKSSKLKVFVGNLPANVSVRSSELIRVMEKAGPVFKVNIVCNPSNGRCKGFAFVTYRHRSSVVRALKMQSLYLRQNRLQCDLTNDVKEFLQGTEDERSFKIASWAREEPVYEESGASGRKEDYPSKKGGARTEIGPEEVLISFRYGPPIKAPAYH